MGALEGDIRSEDATLLVIYTSFGWDLPIADAAEHIGEAFEGGYWTGNNPPIPLTVLPANAIIDMRTGVLLAKTGDISEPEDILQYVIEANSD